MKMMMMTNLLSMTDNTRTYKFYFGSYRTAEVFYGIEKNTCL